MDPMTPAERLIAKKLLQYVEDDFDTGTALSRTANELGVGRDRVLKVWVQHRLDAHE